jgi:hypothetical protein
MLRGIVALVLVGILAAVLGVACSNASLPDSRPPPPSAVAAPWEGCYVCSTSMTGIPRFYYPDGGGWGIDGAISATFTDGLAVGASADTLTGWVAGLDGGGSCYLLANVKSIGEATLITSSTDYGAYRQASCNILVGDDPLLLAVYTGGALTLGE